MLEPRQAPVVHVVVVMCLKGCIAIYHAVAVGEMLVDKDIILGWNVAPQRGEEKLGVAYHDATVIHEAHIRQHRQVPVGERGCKVMTTIVLMIAGNDKGALKIAGAPLHERVPGKRPCPEHMDVAGQEQHIALYLKRVVTEVLHVVGELQVQVAGILYYHYDCDLKILLRS